MSIAGKITIIAENQQRVYDAGFAKGQAAGGGGGFGEDLLKYATTVNFNNLNLFGKDDMVLNLDRLTIGNNMLNDVLSNTTVKHLTVNISAQVIAAYQMFQARAGDLAMEHLTLNADFSKAQSCNEFLRYRRRLKVVDGTPLDFSSMTNTATNVSVLDCEELEEIRFAPNSLKVKFLIPQSPLLSAESIQSIIDALSDRTGQTAQTVTFHATVGEKLTEEQKAAITAKNWTLVY